MSTVNKTILALIGLATSVSIVPTSYASTSNSDPTNQIFITSSAMMGTHLFDGADSAWIDGDWHEKNGLSAPRYLTTFLLRKSGKTTPAIQVLNLNMSDSKQVLILQCPRNIGHIGITGIGSSHHPLWYLVHFNSTSGVTGTVNLLTHYWTFRKPKASVDWVPIDPIRRLSRPEWMVIPHETSVWIDGDWHATNGFGQRYVSSFVGSHGGQGFIQVQDNNRGSLNHYYFTRGPLLYTYRAPSNIGYFTITSITDHGQVVHVQTQAGITEAFDLSSHQWLRETSKP